MKKLILLVIILAPIFLFGQKIKTDPMIAEKWKEIDRLNSIGNFEQTAPIVKEIKAYAKKNNDAPMLIRAILAESQFLRINTMQKDFFSKVEKHFQENINETNGVQKSLLYGFYAQFLGSNSAYYSEGDNKFLTSDEKTKNKIIDSIFQKSIENKDLLLKDSIDKWLPLFADTTNVSLTPTLYHFNINSYLAFLRLDREANISRIESLSNDLLAINAKGSYHNATSYLLLNNISKENGDPKDKINELKKIIAQNKSDFNAYIYSMIASLAHQQGNSTEGIGYLEKAKMEYPTSPWLREVAVIEHSIKKAELDFRINKILPSNEYSPIELSFRNTEKLFIKIFNTTNTPKNFKRYKVEIDSITYKVSLDAKEVYSEVVELKDFGDYKFHSTIYKINPLPYGSYELMISNNSEFINDGAFNTVSTSKFLVSDLFISSGIDQKIDNTQSFIGSLMNRKSGNPYANKTLNIFDINSGKQPKLKRTVKTNAVGKFKISKISQEEPQRIAELQIFIPEENQLIDIENYEQFTGNVDFWDNESINFNSRTLTDRAIYRPGQKILFKTIVYSSNLLAGKIEAEKKVQIILKDANGQKVDSLNLTTNGFGSVNGELQIPNNILAGGFNILVLENGNQIGFHFIRVEEYKRPTFKVSFDENKDTYKRSDIAVFSGKAESLSGANLSGATVNYIVNISSHSPRYKSFLFTDSSVIADENGKFSIKVPLEDTALMKYENFTISITAEVVNQTGEMQSGFTFYTYSDKPWRINILTPYQVEAGKWDSVEIRTVNQNGQPLKFAGEIKIFKYPEPGITLPTDFRNIFLDLKYNLLSNEEYKKYFPTIFDESLESKQESELIKTYSFDTNDTTKIKIDPELFKKGKYYIQAMSIQGKDTVTSVHNIQVFDPVTKKTSDHDYLVYSFDKESYGQGDQVKVTFYTDIKEAELIYLYPYTDIESLETITIPVKDGKAFYEFTLDKEKFNKSYRIQAMLVVDNKQENVFVNIPIKGKDQDYIIKINTFRDKITPGVKEKWSFNIFQKDRVVPTEVLATMYDMSLDAFAGNYYPAFFDKNNSFYFRTFHRLGENFNQVQYSNRLPDYWSIENLTGIELPNVYNYGLWDYMWLSPNEIVYYGYGANISSSLAGKVSGMAANAAPARLILRGASSIEATVVDARQVVEEVASQDLLANKLNEPPNIENNEFEIDLDQVQARTNLQETAFFYPTLYTDKDGNISFEFDSPEALTTWKLLLFAHGKNLEVGSGQFVTQTQKQLMVRPNLPRYFRESDEIELISQIQNLSDQAQQGQAKIEIINPVDNSVITDKFVISPVTTDFRVEKSSNQTVSWKLKIPEGYPTVQVKVVAASEAFSDGEAQELPILSNKVLISETEKITLKAGENRTFEIDAAGKDNLQAKVQVQSNPILEIISAIDYLKNYPYECTEQTSSKWFGLKMVQYIGKNYPAISEYFKTIKSRETKSRLEENAELSELKLQEMPWLRDIQHDDKRIDQLAELFNSNIGSELNSLEQKLIRSQLDNGAFPWFEGGKEDQHISIRILEIVGKVYNLDPTLVDSDLNGSMKKLAGYLDKEREITKPNSSATLALDYLYARHFWNSELKVPEDNKQVLKTKIAKAPLITAKGPAGYAAKAWIVNQLFGDSKEANEIRNRIQQEVILDPEKGMYWESNGKSYNDISLHSYLLEAYRLYDPSKLNQISQWIFYRKEANYWRSTWSTVDAIYSLLLTNNPKDFSLDNNVTVLVDGQRSTMDSVVLGQVSRTFDGEELSSNRSVQVQNHNDRPVFGGVFHQYFLPVSEVRSSTNDLKVSKQYMVERNGKWIESNEAKLGEKIKIVITLINDQNLEYVHLKDSRPAGVEPVFVPSGYNWRNNYYFTLKDASTNYFFGNLAKGKRTFEYEVKANNIGVFNSGITTIESMYDPTVNARSDNKVITIVK